MTVVGLDDTDSRCRGMCTTYLAVRVAERIVAAGGTVDRRVLVRLNPAIEHKTRGNAALAIHTDLDPARAFALAREELESLAETADPRTSPGLVATGDDPGAVPEAVAAFARAAVRDVLALSDALALLEDLGYRHAGWGNVDTDEGSVAADGGAGGVGVDPVDADAVAGRGRIGALAAVGAWRAFDEWTHEAVAYRPPERWGTPREVDRDSVFAAAERGYPAVWDTVDRVEDEAVCVPGAPGPILYGVRGDDPETARAVREAIDAEAAERTATFVTNQGTDAHLQPGRIGALREQRSYRVDGVVAAAPETRRGGHVFLELRAPGGDARLRAAAFEPTKRFRDRVRALRPGDRVTACGEVADGTLKLEKFAVRGLARTELVTPDCPDCGRSMESAGRNQGYRCRDCGTGAPGKAAVALDRDLERGWYEVPPCARRHLARPLVRGGFDAPVHPER